VRIHRCLLLLVTLLSLSRPAYADLLTFSSLRPLPQRHLDFPLRLLSPVWSWPAESRLVQVH